MGKKLNHLLNEAYHRWKDDPNPPVTINLIREHLAAEGIHVDEDKTN